MDRACSWLSNEPLLTLIGAVLTTLCTNRPHRPFLTISVACELRRSKLTRKEGRSKIRNSSFFWQIFAYFFRHFSKNRHFYSITCRLQQALCTVPQIDSDVKYMSILSFLSYTIIQVVRVTIITANKERSSILIAEFHQLPWG